MADSDKLDEYKLDLMEAIVRQVQTTIAEERKSKGAIFSEELALSILASLVLNVMLDALNKYPKNEDMRDAEYMDMKTSLENGIASAFSQAFAEFDPKGRTPAFVCEIEPVPLSQHAH